MRILGSSPTVPAFKGEGVNRSITVGEWLESQGIPAFYNPNDFVGKIPDDDKIAIGAVTDIPELAFPEGWDESNLQVRVFDQDGVLISKVDEEYIETPGPKLEDILLYDSIKCAPYCQFDMTYEAGEVKELVYTMLAGNFKIFKILFDKGFIFHYFSMNRLLVLLTQTASIAADGSTVMLNKVFNLVYYEMLQYIVSKGIKMDLEQYKLLENFSKTYANEIEKIYSNPVWKKVCSSSLNIPLPASVKTLAASLNIDASLSKKEICSRIATLSTKDAEEVKQAEYAKHKFMLRSGVISSSDLNQDRPVYCKNVTGEDIDPLRFNDISFAYYKDARDNVWCFNAGDYKDLLENPYNPITKERLPKGILRKMRDAVDTYEMLNIQPTKIITFDDAIDKLVEADEINNTDSDRIVSQIYIYGQIRGVSPYEIKMLSSQKMNAILEFLEMGQSYFLDLKSKDHQIITFCRALNLYLKDNMEQIDKVFEIIKQ